ncbi:CapA family protein [Thermoanaerobacter sp. A7A]|uniref:CapA family protein n=1 Tax=Thermoanaerobacter sp. A7A TaxID=1350366 RepID=UPI00041D5C97|nr:CapA family protein [Thermoanaerobacter sp. A7A]
MKGKTVTKILIFIFLIVSIIAIPLTAENLGISETLLKEFIVEKKPQSLPQEDVHKEDNYTKIVISAVGDCALGSDESYGKFGTFDEELKKHNYDYGYFFENVKNILDKDDLTIANLETTFTTATKKANKEYAFKGEASYARILKEGSIEVVNLANNHTFDYLREGFEDTIRALKKEGIEYFGYGYKYVTNIKGIKVGVLGYTGFDNTMETKNQIKKDIIELRSNVNILVVSFHWGEENQYYPNKIQKDLGHFVIDEGVDLVIGHHPHVIQGIEKYKNRYIAYSLGNFSFGGNRNPKDKDSLIFQQTFILNDKGEIIDIEEDIIPVSVSSQKDRNDFKPIILEGKEKEKVLKKIEMLSKGIN